MTRPPRPDKMPGPIRTKKPTGKPEDRPLEKIHQERKAHLRARNGDDPATRRRPRS
jgi:hypothetical protein